MNESHRDRRPNSRAVWGLGLCLLLLASCAKEEPEVVKPRPVKTFTVTEPAQVYERVFSGQLNAREGTGIGFQVGGRITSLDVKVGQRVEIGEVIAQLDDSNYVNQQADAAAQYEQARQELQRTSRLFESGNASQSQLDGAIARSQSTKAALELAKRRVRDCVLRMPYSGLVGNVPAEVQQVVNPGQEIVSIQGDDGLEFQVGVPAEIVGEITQGLTATLVISGQEALTYTGKLTEISPQAASNTTYPVTITLDEEDDRIRAGMDGVAKILLPVKLEAVHSVPVECVVAQAGTKPFVWGVESTSNGLGRIKRLEVSLGDLRPEGQVAILSGLQTGDHIVSRGVHRVEAGLEVRLEPELQLD